MGLLTKSKNKRKNTDGKHHHHAFRSLLIGKDSKKDTVAAPVLQTRNSGKPRRSRSPTLKQAIGNDPTKTGLYSHLNRSATEILESRMKSDNKFKNLLLPENDKNIDTNNFLLEHDINSINNNIENDNDLATLPKRYSLNPQHTDLPEIILMNTNAKSIIGDNPLDNLEDISTNTNHLNINDDATDITKFHIDKGTINRILTNASLSAEPSTASHIFNISHNNTNNDNTSNHNNNKERKITYLYDKLSSHHHNNNNDNNSCRGDLTLEDIDNSINKNTTIKFHKNTHSRKKSNASNRTTPRKKSISSTLNSNYSEPQSINSIDDPLLSKTNSNASNKSIKSSSSKKFKFPKLSLSKSNSSLSEKTKDIHRKVSEKAKRSLSTSNKKSSTHKHTRSKSNNQNEPLKTIPALRGPAHFVTDTDNNNNSNSNTTTKKNSPKSDREKNVMKNRIRSNTTDNREIPPPLPSYHPHTMKIKTFAPVTNNKTINSNSNSNHYVIHSSSPKSGHPAITVADHTNDSIDKIPKLSTIDNDDPTVTKKIIKNPIFDKNQNFPEKLTLPSDGTTTKNGSEKTRRRSKTETENVQGARNTSNSALGKKLLEDTHRLTTRHYRSHSVSGGESLTSPDDDDTSFYSILPHHHHKFHHHDPSTTSTTKIKEESQPHREHSHSHLLEHHTHKHTHSHGHESIIEHHAKSMTDIKSADSSPTHRHRGILLNPLDFHHLITDSNDDTISPSCSLTDMSPLKTIQPIVKAIPNLMSGTVTSIPRASSNFLRISPPSSPIASNKRHSFSGASPTTYSAPKKSIEFAKNAKSNIQNPLITRHKTISTPTNNSETSLHSSVSGHASSLISMKNAHQTASFISGQSLHLLPTSMLVDSHTTKSSHSTRHPEEDAVLGVTLDDKFLLHDIPYASSKKDAEFHQIFQECNNVSPLEKLIEEVSGAISRDILLQGKLYISERNVCFNSNILGFTNTVVIPFAEIVQMKKKSTVGIFPNGIVIDTLHDKYKFASILNRDYIFDLLTNIWNQVILGRRHKGSQEDATQIDASSDNSDIDTDIDSDYESETSATSQEDDNTTISKSKKGSALGPTHHAPTNPAYTPTSGEKMIMERTINAPLSHVADVLLGNDTSYMTNILQKEKAYDISPIPPILATKTRSYSYTKPLNGGKIGPSKTRCNITEQLDHYDLEDHVKLIQISKTPDVPSGNSFEVKSTYFMSWGPNNSTKISIYLVVEWTGKSWIKGAIEKGTFDGVPEDSKVLLNEVENYVKTDSKYKADIGTTVSRVSTKASVSKFASIPNSGPTTHAPTIPVIENEKDEKIINQDVNIPAPMGVVFQLLFGDDTSFMKTVVTTQKNINISPIPKFSGDTRDYNYVKPLNNSLGPKQTKCMITENIEHRDFESYCLVRQICKTPDVPSGNNFSVQTRIYLSWGPKNTTNFTAITNIVWTGKSFLKGAIEKGSIDGQKSSNQLLVESINTIVASIVSSAHSKEGGKLHGKKHKKVVKAHEAIPAVAVAVPVPEPVQEKNIIATFLDLMDVHSFKFDALLVFILLLLHHFITRPSYPSHKQMDMDMVQTGRVIIGGNEYKLVPNIRTLYGVYEENARTGGKGSRTSVLGDKKSKDKGQRNMVVNTENNIWDWLNDRGNSTLHPKQEDAESLRNWPDELEHHKLQQLENAINIAQDELTVMRKQLTDYKKFEKLEAEELNKFKNKKRSESWQVIEESDDNISPEALL